MPNPQRESRFRVVLPVLLCLLATVACQSTPEPVEAPARGDIDTAGWETPPAVPPVSAANQAEMEEIRRKNQDLSDQVKVLSAKMIELNAREAAPAPAPDPVAPPEPRPVAGTARVDAAAEAAIDARRLEAAIRQAGISDLDVSVSADGETFVRLPGSLSFRAGSADLMKPARTRLARLVEVLRATYPAVGLRIEGHTDSDPIRKSNWEDNHHLSSARAGAVSKFFVRTLGWSDANVSSRGYGADDPVATNSTREGKAQNRRIEIVLVP